MQDVIIMRNAYSGAADNRYGLMCLFYLNCAVFPKTRAPFFFFFVANGSQRSGRLTHLVALALAACTRTAIARLALLAHHASVLSSPSCSAGGGRETQ